MYKPYVVKSLNEPVTNTVVKQNNPTKVRTVISEETSKKVREALESVVTNGTGRPAYIEGYRVGGKTGTAQKVKDGKYMVGNYIVSFIGFLPADDPEIIVYIAVDNAKGVTQYGGTIAAPIAKNVLTDAIDILGIEKRDTTTEKKYNYGEKKYVTIPDVLGMEVSEAKNQLKGFDLEFSGSGNKISYQSPQAGTRVLEGSSIRLMLTE